MQGAWRVVDCTDFRGTLGYKRATLVVKRDGDQETKNIPLANVAVVLIGLHASCSSALLHQLAHFGVSVLLCDWRHVPIAGFYQWTDTPTRVAARHIAQAEQSVPRKKSAWQAIVKAKISGQAEVLRRCGREGADLLDNLARSVRSGDLSNVEGQAARAYWSFLFEGVSFSRVPGAGSGYNAGLDYAYMLLRGFMTKAVIAAGLSPTLGVHHHRRGNYFCLVDDLIEPFRPSVDGVVVSLGGVEGGLTRDMKATLLERVNGEFDESGLTIPSAMNAFAQHYGLFVEENVARLSSPIFMGAS